MLEHVMLVLQITVTQAIEVSQASTEALLVLYDNMAIATLQLFV
jgi:hypothetical protein